MTVKRTFEILSSGPAPDAEGRLQPVIFGQTDTGCVRVNNEDQFLVAQLERALVVQQSGFPIDDGKRLADAPSWLLMVADGMGGPDAGELASSVAIDAMTHYAFTMMPWIGAASRTDSAALATGLRDAVIATQERVRAVAERKGVSGALGTTFTMAYVAWPQCVLVHVGDSRAYLMRQDELFRLTKDHNLAQSMVERGVLTEEEARTSRFSSVLTNALGGSSNDLHVELNHFELQVGDRMLLCTDGLYGELGDSSIGSALAACVRPALTPLCVQSLIDRARKAGGGDNVTAVLASF